MQRVLGRLLLALGLLAVASWPPARASEPVGLIFDTDMCGDCDDVLALGMIHALQSRGECRLLAVTVSADHELAAPFIDAVNTFYGRGDIPIGVVGKGGVVEESGFLSLVQQQDDGRDRYPHDLRRGDQAPPATEVLRKTLASQPDNSVVVVQVGFSTNLARLLETKADAISPLDGVELVRRKVKFLSAMAGAFQPINGNTEAPEYNVVKDVDAARILVERWPTSILFSGFEVGIALPYPASSIERDYRYVAHHPVAEAYIRRNPPPHNRPTWDLTSVLQAVRPKRGYFQQSAQGTVFVRHNGSTGYSADQHGRHVYLILDPSQNARVLEALTLLSSEPPHGHPDCEPGR
jgi:inosine-uridine nucleoside N-ribohydrolase